MKKTLILVSLLAAAVTSHASTCETRVDKHQKATTLQRVDYCLTPEQAAPAAPGPEVIVSSVTTKEPAPAAQKSAPLTQEYYPQDQVEVTHGYVGTTHFPQFKNDISSERELKEMQQAANDAAKKEATFQQPARVMAPAKTAGQTASRTADNNSGKNLPVKNEQKPARTMANTSSMMERVESEIIAPAAVYNEAYPADAYPAPTMGDVSREADELFTNSPSYQDLTNRS